MHQVPEYVKRAGQQFQARLDAAAELAGDYWAVPLPAKLESGPWRIEEFTLPHPLPLDVQIQNLRRIQEGMPEFVVSAGTYHRLVGPCGDDGEDAVMMSNTQLEYRTNRDFVRAARGHVLIAGLGIGMLLDPLFGNPEVESVTVLELERDVINMVGRIYMERAAGRLDIYHADARTYVPRRSFDAIMLDIWPTISPDNLDDMAAMTAHYRTYLNWGGHIECWSEPLARRMVAQVIAEIAEMRAMRGAA